MKHAYSTFAFVALAVLPAGNAFAAETNKIHIREAWYGEDSQTKVCKPNLASCEGKSRCEVAPKDYKCKTAAKPNDIQLNIVWDCGDYAHAAGHGAGPGTGKQTYIFTCPYVPRLNP